MRIEQAIKLPYKVYFIYNGKLCASSPNKLIIGEYSQKFEFSNYNDGHVFYASIQGCCSSVQEIIDFMDTMLTTQKRSTLKSVLETMEQMACLRNISCNSIPSLLANFPYYDTFRHYRISKRAFEKIKAERPYCINYNNFR